MNFTEVQEASRPRVDSPLAVRPKLVVDTVRTCDIVESPASESYPRKYHLAFSYAASSFGGPEKLTMYEQ